MKDSTKTAGHMAEEKCTFLITPSSLAISSMEYQMAKEE